MSTGTAAIRSPIPPSGRTALLVILSFFCAPFCTSDLILQVSPHQDSQEAFESRHPPILGLPTPPPPYCESAKVRFFFCFFAASPPPFRVRDVRVVETRSLSLRNSFIISFFPFSALCAMIRAVTRFAFLLRFQRLASPSWGGLPYRPHASLRSFPPITARHTPRLFGFFSLPVFVE